jgi:hypothetical protein
MKNDTSNFDAIVDSIGRLIEMNDAANDRFAAGLYRSMFRNETDLNKLDFNYADHVLSFATCGCENAVEDYKNYLLYIKKLYPTAYPEYAKMLEEATKSDDEED